jgi:hypothetical protein
MTCPNCGAHATKTVAGTVARTTTLAILDARPGEPYVAEAELKTVANFAACDRCEWADEVRRG